MDIEQLHKFVKDAQEATSATAVANSLDYAVAMLGRMNIIRDIINNNLPEGFDPIPEFDPVPSA
jgi:hypothetical protein